MLDVLLYILFMMTTFLFINKYCTIFNNPLTKEESLTSLNPFALKCPTS